MNYFHSGRENVRKLWPALPYAAFVLSEIRLHVTFSRYAVESDIRVTPSGLVQVFKTIPRGATWDTLFGSAAEVRGPVGGQIAKGKKKQAAGVVGVGVELHKPGEKFPINEAADRVAAVLSEHHRETMKLRVTAAMEYFQRISRRLKVHDRVDKDYRHCVAQVDNYLLGNWPAVCDAVFRCAKGEQVKTFGDALALERLWDCFETNGYKWPKDSHFQFRSNGVAKVEYDLLSYCYVATRTLKAHTRDDSTQRDLLNSLQFRFGLLVTEKDELERDVDLWFKDKDATTDGERSSLPALECSYLLTVSLLLSELSDAGGGTGPTISTVEALQRKLTSLSEELKNVCERKREQSVEEYAFCANPYRDSGRAKNNVLPVICLLKKRPVRHADWPCRIESNKHSGRAFLDHCLTSIVVKPHAMQTVPPTCLASEHKFRCFVFVTRGLELRAIPWICADCGLECKTIPSVSEEPTPEGTVEAEPSAVDESVHVDPVTPAQQVAVQAPQPVSTPAAPKAAAHQKQLPIAAAQGAKPGPPTPAIKKVVCPEWRYVGDGKSGPRGSCRWGTLCKFAAGHDYDNPREPREVVVRHDDGSFAYVDVETLSLTNGLRSLMKRQNDYSKFCRSELFHFKSNCRHLHKK